MHTIKCQEFHELMMEYRAADYVSSNPQDAYEKIVALIDSKLQKAGEPVLRDQFAMAALPALITENWMPGMLFEQTIVTDAYNYADAMMEARKQK